MAVVIQGTHGTYPGMRYQLDAEQTGGSGNSRTVKLTLHLKCGGSTSSAWYGFPVDWKGRVNNSYSDWKVVKGTESWDATNGWRAFYWTATVDVGTTSSKTITVGFQTNSYSGDNSWDLTKTGSFTVGATNTAPTMSGSVTIINNSASGAVLTGIIPENISRLYLKWNAGSDREQGSSGLKYGVNEKVNGGGGVTVVYPTTNTYATVDIGTGNEGQRRQYYVDCRDNSNALSNAIYSVEITKNRFTGDTLASNSSIDFNSSSIAFTYSGASNTNGEKTFTRALSCNEVTVYNPSVGANSATVSIWKGGALPSGCYVRFEDIRERFKNSNYAGTLAFTLTTTNYYGTIKTSTKIISVDLKTQPSPASGVTISTVVSPGGTTGSESTIYKKAAFNNTFYFVPDGIGVARVKWSAGASQLGEIISYEVYVSYENGAWEKIADLPGNVLYYNHVVPRQQSISQRFKYRVRTKSSYGHYSDSESAEQVLHCYSAASISVGQINRTETEALIPVTISNISSIPGIGVTGTWSGKGSGQLTSMTTQTIRVTQLTGGGTYTIEVVYNDTTGFSPNQTRRISIGANLPVMFLNQYGLGVGGRKASSAAALTVSGGAAISGTFGVNSGSVADFNSCLTEGEYYCGSSSTIPNAPYQNSIFGKLTVTVSDGGTHNNSSNWIWQYFMDTSGRYYKRNKTNSGAWTSWAIEYDTRSNPALPLAGGTMTGQIKTPTSGALADANGNVFLRNNGAGATILSTTNGSIYLRTGGDTTVTNEVVIKNTGEVSAPSFKLSGSDNGELKVLTGSDGKKETVITSNNGHAFRLREDNKITYGGYWLYSSFEQGDIQKVATRADNLNNLTTRSGWYAWNGSTVGRPTNYGVCLNIVWNDTDTYQFAIGSNSACWTRVRVNNGAWSAWALK